LDSITFDHIRSLKHIDAYFQDKPLVKFKSHFYFEEKDRVTEATKALEPLPGAKITFFKNGECLGEAFTDIFAVGLNRWK
jgi:hypothetical protein